MFLAPKERNNPRMLKPYNPWWMKGEDDKTNDKKVTAAWKIADLQAEAERRGITGIEGLKKADLFDR